jgi:thiol-disulfide isomerase/thioredoxin
MNRLRVSAIAVLLLLLLCACGEEAEQVTGTLVPCTSIATIEVAEKSILTECLDGGVGVDVSKIKGPAIVNVWGSWCGPCKDELPIFKEFYAELEPTIQLIGVDVEETSINAGRKFALEQGITWPNLFDRDGQTRAIFGMGVPVTWFIGSDGKVVAKHIGVITSIDQLRETTEKAFGKR